MVVHMCAGTLGWFGMLVWRCTGQCGPVVLMTLLSLAESFFDSASRWIIFWKVTCVHVRPTSLS